MKNLTKDELRTLCWMCEKEAARIALEELENHRKPSDSKTRQRVIAISKKAYAELIKRNEDAK